MTVSDRIFMKMEELSMTQKEFSETTGILQSTISEWKKRKTNPLSDKIMPICEVLGVTPEWLLTGDDTLYYTVKKDTDAGRLMADYQKLDPHYRERILGYAEAIIAMNKAEGKDNP